MKSFVEIAVNLWVEGHFIYAVPDRLSNQLELGHRVLVPFGPRRVTGFVVAFVDSVEPELLPRIKTIIERLDDTPLITPDILELARFAAGYYLAPLGEVLKLAVPPGLTGASVQRLQATPQGRRTLEEDTGALSPRARELLTDAARRSGVRGTRTRTRLADQLIDRGLVERRDDLSPRDAEEHVEWVERAKDPKAAWPYLKRAPIRRALYGLLEAGPSRRTELSARLGTNSVARALKALVEQGVVRIQRRSERQSHDEPATKDAGSGTPEGRQTPPTPTPAQTRAYARLSEALHHNGGAFLLQGVTGSGKTEVYLRIIVEARQRGLGAIVLLPEIALTPQLEARFRARLGPEVTVLHSRLTDSERRKRWHRLRTGRASIALGPRSAVWAPVNPLGVVVVDEEHDSSFKQGSDVRYHGRDLALVRAQRAGAICVLGSATPSFESLHLVHSGRLERLRLDERVWNRPMPRLKTVDLVEEKRAMKGQVSLLSRALVDELRAAITREEQAILFLNRRGFNTIVYCEECGEPRTCERCSVTLTHHLSRRVLSCHHCGHEEPFDRACGTCGGRAMQPMGAGTERVAAAVAADVPGARVLRLDRDITQRVGALEETLEKFRAREADVLVGTQMVTKGHDFPLVTLVGIVLADASLALPDFRAAERTFQLVTQVAGRAGRAERPGQVIVQAFSPQHPALVRAMTHDVDGFYAEEIGSRVEAGYPPHTRLACIRAEAKDQSQAEKWAARAAAEARRQAHPYGLRVTGPAPAPIERIRERYRFVVLVFAPRPASLAHAMSRVRSRLQEAPDKVEVFIDMDPVDLL